MSLWLDLIPPVVGAIRFVGAIANRPYSPIDAKTGSVDGKLD